MAALPDIRKVPIEYLKCREQGHDMDYYIPLDKSKLKAPFGVRERKRCLRCGAERNLLVSSFNGEILHSKYEYDDAQAYDDAKHFTKAECRQEIARRIRAGRVELRGGDSKPRERKLRAVK